MTLFAALTDNFDAPTRDTTKWGASYGTLRQQNGKAGIQSDSGYPGWRSSSAYTLTGSYVFAQVSPAPVAGTGTSAVTSEMLVDSPTGGTRIIIQADTRAGTIVFRNDVGYGDGSAVRITYDPAAHAWWRIRETAGTIYMDTAADGLTWLARRSFPTPAWVSGGSTLPVQFSTHRNDGTATWFEFDNFNLSPPIDVTVTASLDPRRWASTLEPRRWAGTL